MSTLFRLFRLPLSLMNGVVTAGGAVLYSGRLIEPHIWLTGLGVALMAASASACNQIMERDLDSLMSRTKTRPLPQKTVTAYQAGISASLTGFSGAALLGIYGGMMPLLVAISTFLWYLMVYTPLKRRTPFALLAGALCGATPPLIGWCSAGGELSDYRIIILAGIFYLWQIPHFWLFQNRYQNDYRAAGFPLLNIPEEILSRSHLFSLWLAAMSTATMLLPAFGLVRPEITLWLALFPLPMFVMNYFRSEKALFSYLNVFPLFLTLTLILSISM